MSVNTDNPVLMAEIYKAEVECLRKVIKEKDEYIEFLKQQLEALSND